jgi:Fanconi anemia group I protein
MEYEFTTNGLTAKSSEMLLNLFKKRKAFLGLLSNSTNEKGRKGSHINNRSCVNMEFMSSLFLTVFSKDVPKEPTRDLRSDIEFVQFIVSSTCDSLKAVRKLFCACIQ